MSFAFLLKSGGSSSNLANNYWWIAETEVVTAPQRDAVCYFEITGMDSGRCSGNWCSWGSDYENANGFPHAGAVTYEDTTGADLDEGIVYTVTYGGGSCSVSSDTPFSTVDCYIDDFHVRAIGYKGNSYNGRIYLFGTYVFTSTTYVNPYLVSAHSDDAYPDGEVIDGIRYRRIYLEEASE